MMEMQTVSMDLMKLMICVTRENVTLRQSLPATMASVFPSCGTVTLMTTVETTVTSLLTGADNRTVLTAGDAAPVTTTTDVSQSGCSVMARMTAEMGLMSCRRTVQSAVTRTSSSATTGDACPGDGCVTSRMTAETTVTRTSPCARVCTESVQSQSSSVTTTSVFLTAGGE